MSLWLVEIKHVSMSRATTACSANPRGQRLVIYPEQMRQKTSTNSFSHSASDLVFFQNCNYVTLFCVEFRGVKKKRVAGVFIKDLLEGLLSAKTTH